MKETRSYRASRSDYVYGSAAPAYAPVPELEFDVIPGHRSSSDIVTLPAWVMSVARVAVAVACVVALLACVRVALSATSVNTSIATSQLSSQIEAARSAGNDLEVQQSRLANSSHIKLEAMSLGMAAPAETTALVLPEDIVAVDEAGNLSLSGSIGAIENAG